MKRASLLFAAFAFSACAPRPQPQPFSKLVEEFVYTTLASSPVSATQVGYHKHNGVELDAKLDDYSPRAIEEQRRWLEDFRLRLPRNVDANKLSPEDRADYEIIQDQISLTLLEFNTIQNYRHNPTLYVEMVGNALYAPFVLEYADKSTRYRHITERLKQTPRFLEQAKRNLTSAPELWTRVAQAENEGNLGLIEGEIRAGAPEDLRRPFEAAAGPALRALRDFNAYLKDVLSQRDYDWRLGAGKYRQKFRYVLATDQSPEQVLAAAESELEATRRQMLEIARPIYQKLKPEDAGQTNLNKTVSTVLNEIAKTHATRETYFSDANRDLAEATQFVQAKDLLTLPAGSNLKVIETPPFMRGIYAVGGFNPAPALEPQLGAFYWITPIPADWPPARVESKLREYNTYGLKVLTIHEAMPGHYVQFEYANGVQPPLRRILRAVFGNGPYVEGWAVYATELLLDHGYMADDPGMRLTWGKQALRVLANTILDVRLQTMGMSDQQALDLMVTQTFQEQEEATAKLQRAKLSSTQLPTYYVGWRDWRRLRERYRQAKGAGFSLKEFHERALKTGAVPLPVLARLLVGTTL